jgi:Flp pilus assembly protein TadG
MTRRKGSAGQALVEMALVLPVLILIVVAIFDFGRAVFAFNSISNAAREGARIGIVDQSTGSSGALVAAEEAAKQATGLGLDPTDAAQIAVTFPNPGGNCVNPGVGCTIRVEVNYEFEAITPLIGGLVNPIDLVAVTEMPIEAEKP